MLVRVRRSMAPVSASTTTTISGTNTAVSTTTIAATFASTTTTLAGKTVNPAVSGDAFGNAEDSKPLASRSVRVSAPSAPRPSKV